MTTIHGNVCRTALVAALMALTAAGATPAEQSGPPRPPQTVSAVDSVVAQQSEQLCGALPSTDLDPLSDGHRYGPGQPDVAGNTLPACRWQIARGAEFLRIGVIEGDVSSLGRAPGYRVGDGTGYQLSPANTGPCDAVVSVPRTPPGSLMAVHVDAAGDTTTNRCRKAVPQTLKALRRLQWITDETMAGALRELADAMQSLEEATGRANRHTFPDVTITPSR